MDAVKPYEYQRKPDRSIIKNEIKKKKEVQTGRKANGQLYGNAHV